MRMNFDMALKTEAAIGPEFSGAPASLALTQPPGRGEVCTDARRLLTMVEVAPILGVSLGRAYELARRGEIPSLRLGRQVRVDRLTLERWLSGETLS